MDKDLEFLKKCSNEQLQMLADRIAYNDKGQTRYNETLTNRRSYVLYYPNNMKELLPDIIDEMSLYAGNTITNVFRGSHVSYRSMLEDVCDTYKVKYNDFNSTEEIEEFFLRKVLLVAADDMNMEDIKHISNTLNSKEDIKNMITTAKIASPILLRMITVIIYKMLSKFGFKLAAEVVVGFAGSRLFAWVTGPVGWVLGTLWTTYDLLGPSYKVTVPCALLIAYYRIVTQKTEEELKEVLS